jgi:DNA mismatch repair protein MutL
MQKIRLLSDFEIGCIAAGEVIENPSSIIKELIENAIDAKATEIKIFFKEGGIEEIIIIDNGSGMSRDDLSLALLPHATSKLGSIDELYYKNNIFFGFRGEALSAISGVAKLTIISREQESYHGFSITSDHGQLSDIIELASNFGTTVIVKNLFEKIPVRKKYLHSIKNQEKSIIYIIIGLVLSHPEINFIIYKDDKLYKEYKPVSNFVSRSYQIASQEKSKYLVIDYEDIYFKLEGIISFYEHGYYDRSKVFILANGRLIKQYKITQSCLKAYNSDNFAKKYPELFLHITVSPDQIDVNVHPRKEEVLFLYQKKIEQLLTEILVRVLENRTKELFVEKINYFSHAQIEPEQKIDTNQYNPRVDFIDKNTTSEKNKHTTNTIDILPEKNYFDSNSVSLINDTIISEECEITKNINEVNKKELISENKHNLLLDLAINKTQPDLFLQEKNRVYLGILAHTYILSLESSGLLFIDQHALHEKILYEQFINNFQTTKLIMKQPLLFEEKITVDKENKELFIINAKVFNSLGIFYDMEVDAIIVKSYPINFLQFDIASLLLNYNFLLGEQSDLSFEAKQAIILHEMAALYACKNAIKAGDKINEKEVEVLLNGIALMDNATFCPHGRPTYYQMGLSYIHALFKRT